MMLLAWIGLSICGGLLIAEYDFSPKKKRRVKRKIIYEKRRAKIHRIK